MTDLSCPLCGAAAAKAKLACPCCKQVVVLTRNLELRVHDIERLHCHACKTSFPTYLIGAEERELIDGVKKALKEQDEGRNQSCWPLVSFGWKDADLDAEGCTGIKRIVDAVEDKLIFEIGGHKTFVSSDCLDTTSEKKRAAFDEAMREIVCSTGYSAEWTGDDWCVSFSSMVSTAILRKDSTAGAVDGLATTSEPDFAATAIEIIRLAQKACRGFEEEMASADKAANTLYSEMAAPPKKPKAKPKAKPKKKTKR